MTGNEKIVITEMIYKGIIWFGKAMEYAKTHGYNVDIHEQDAETFVFKVTGRFGLGERDTVPPQHLVDFDQGVAMAKEDEGALAMVYAVSGKKGGGNV